MLKNRFRKLVGVLILLVFALAVVQFTRQTAGNAFVGPALLSGLGFLAFLAAVLGLAYWADRRTRQAGR